MKLQENKIMLQNYFDKVVYVNLDRREDRKIECELELQKHNIIAERISAVDAQLLDMNNPPEEAMNRMPPASNFKHGCYGLLLTNIRIFNMAKKNKYSSIVILEDDVKFIDDFNEYFELLYQQVPSDWNMLYLGANHIIPPTMVTDNVGKCVKTWTTHAVIFKESSYDIILQELYKLNNPLDVMYANILYKLNAYSFCPSIVHQRPSYSDIENGFMDYAQFIK